MRHFMNSQLNRQVEGDAGFSLVETVIAMGILATGLLSLAGVFTLGMLHIAGSSSNLIAREKAREAIESVHTARDTKTITWAQIRNVEDGGVFLKEPQPLYKSGVDGLVNTVDDDDDGELEEQLGPGEDNKLGTEDDLRIPLVNYTRTIEITESLGPNGEDTLRQLVVTVTYPVGGARRVYTITTFISSIS
jgi:type II secretory pathway pseudopilin PulG